MTWPVLKMTPIGQLGVLTYNLVTKRQWMSEWRVYVSLNLTIWGSDNVLSSLIWRIPQIYVIFVILVQNVRLILMLDFEEWFVKGEIGHNPEWLWLTPSIRYWEITSKRVLVLTLTLNEIMSKPTKWCHHMRNCLSNLIKTLRFSWFNHLFSALVPLNIFCKSADENAARETSSRGIPDVIPGDGKSLGEKCVGNLWPFIYVSFGWYKIGT